LQPDQLKLALQDSARVCEIILLTSLITACSTATQRLRQEHLDAVLGLPPRDYHTTPRWPSKHRTTLPSWSSTAA